MDEKQSQNCVQRACQYRYSDRTQDEVELLGRRRRRAWGRIRTDMERKKNTEGDVLERQKCDNRGREIRRDWWERGEDERKSGE